MHLHTLHSLCSLMLAYRCCLQVFDDCALGQTTEGGGLATYAELLAQLQLLDARSLALPWYTWLMPLACKHT